MTRDFAPVPLGAAVIEECLELASWSPSAGKSQGWNVIGLLDDATEAYWSAAMDAETRDSFAFPGLFAAPFVGVVTADPAAYVARYAEPDKSHTGLGRGAGAWSVPYWTVDASMATMTFLHALHDAGLGALFFAVAHEDRVRDVLGIPEEVQIIGAVAAGVPAGGDARRGRSADRRRRAGREIVRWGRW